MQALKKAERAKQNAGDDSELDKPSAAFDELLALTPEPAPPGQPQPAKRELSLDLEPKAEFSLEPLAPMPAPQASLTPRPAPDPSPAPSDHKQPGLTLDLAPDPSAPPAMQAPAPAPAPSHAPAPTPATARADAPPAQAKPAKAEQSGKGNRGAKGDAGDKPRGAARARAAAAASADEPTGMDPERLRLIGWIVLLVLIAAGFGYYYWQAVAAPGAGARLPPVPMPPPGATGATNAQQSGTPVAADPGAAESSGAMLSAAPQRGNRDDLERRLARAEQELASTQQVLQTQATAPRVEKLPPIAAPDNGDIRVARNVQPSKVAPALEQGYQAFNNGDLGAAQQQYEAALRQDPNSHDALLGLATVHTRQNHGAQAAAYYQRLLELDPADGAAVAGLVGLRQGDASASENRLKAMLSANPESAPLLFALGNLYAQQGRWPDAQQQYFRAYSAAPDNPDYAYNLAIGLDRLNQGKLALTYYQRALALAQDKAAAFDRNALRTRMHELSAAAR
jgi:tetratricopeptide (TPR) repeat protein